VDIPGNYGSATLKVTVFDVVDTLDDLSTATKVFEQPFFLKYIVPEPVAKYWSERITLPPMSPTRRTLTMNSRTVLPVLLNEGRTPAQIADDLLMRHFICLVDHRSPGRTRVHLSSRRYCPKSLAVVATKEAGGTQEACRQDIKRPGRALVKKPQIIWRRAGRTALSGPACYGRTPTIS